MDAVVGLLPRHLDGVRRQGRREDAEGQQPRFGADIAGDALQQRAIAPMAVEEHETLEAACLGAAGNVEHDGGQGRGRQPEGAGKTQVLVALRNWQRRQPIDRLVVGQILEREFRQPVSEIEIAVRRQMRPMLFNRADRQNENRTRLVDGLDLRPGKPVQISLHENLMSIRTSGRSRRSAGTSRACDPPPCKSRTSARGWRAGRTAPVRSRYRATGCRRTARNSDDVAN